MRLTSSRLREIIAEETRKILEGTSVREIKKSVRSYMRKQMRTSAGAADFSYDDLKISVDRGVDSENFVVRVYRLSSPSATIRGNAPVAEADVRSAGSGLMSTGVESTDAITVSYHQNERHVKTSDFVSAKRLVDTLIRLSRDAS